MAKHKNKPRQTNHGGLIALGILGLIAVITMLLAGNDVALFNPKGRIAGEQFNLLMLATGIMLVIAIPTLFLMYFFAWRYRESNVKSTYNPGANHHKLFVAGIWILPTVFMLILASIMWPATYKLEPKKTIAHDVEPLTIQVVALRWKWLFLYPEQNVASVNFVQFPADRPVRFVLTADETPMSSFWIPHLGGQLYAMTGHVTELNLIADEIGDYPGSTAEINGRGFSGMKFTVRASSNDDFDQWVRQTRQLPVSLDEAEYKNLLAPSENHPAAQYSSFDPELHDKMLMKYNGSHDHEIQADEAAH